MLIHLVADTQAMICVWRTDNDASARIRAGNSRTTESHAGSEAHQTQQSEVGMTRTDVMASSRPQTPAAASSKGRSPLSARRSLLACAVALAMALLAMPGAALAAEGTSTYGQTPSTPTTTPSTPTTTPSTPTTTPTPTTGTSPSKETEKPAGKEEPAKTSGTTPSASSPEKASTLPFTGLDLRWVAALGVLLIGAGFLLLATQRRRGSR
jgi:hypothetical protein